MAKIGGVEESALSEAIVKFGPGSVLQKIQGAYGVTSDAYKAVADYINFNPVETLQNASSKITRQNTEAQNPDTFISSAENPYVQSFGNAQSVQQPAPTNPYGNLVNETNLTAANTPTSPYANAVQDANQKIENAGQAFTPVTKTEIEASRNDAITDVISQNQGLTADDYAQILNNNENGDTIGDISTKEIQSAIDSNTAGYKGVSVEDYLNSIGQDGRYTNRVDIADRLGIENYKGTADQNAQMLSLLRAENSTGDDGISFEDPQAGIVEGALSQTELASLTSARDQFSDEELLQRAADLHGINSAEYTTVQNMLTNNPRGGIPEYSPETIDNIVNNMDDYFTSDNLITDQKVLTDRDNARINALETIRSGDLNRLSDDYNKTLSLLSTNNSALLSMYGINADGTIDNTNTDGFAYKYDQMQKDYEAAKQESFQNFEGTRLSQVQGQIRAELIKRGVDVSKIPEEQLLALSSRIGQDAFTDIYTAKETMNNEILANAKDTLAKLNDLREKGLISQSEFLTNAEELRQGYTTAVATINKDFANTVFGIEDAAVITQENDAKDVMNTITSLGTSLGLSGTALGVMQGFVNSSTDGLSAYKAIFEALSNPTSELYIAIANAEKAANAQALFDNQIKQQEANARTSSANSSGTSANDAFSGTVRTALIAEYGDMKNIEQVKTYNDLMILREAIIKSAETPEQEKLALDKFNAVIKKDGLAQSIVAGILAAQ